MAIADLATATADASNVASITYSHTVAGTTDLALWVEVSTYSGPGVDPSGITYGGVALTKIANYLGGTGNDNAISLWRLAAPATGANDVVVTFAAPATSTVVMSVSYSGVNQTTPNDTVQVNDVTTDTPSHDITSATGDQCVSFGNAYNTGGGGIVYTGTGTERLENNNGGSMASVAVADAPGASSVTMSWSFSTATAPLGQISFNVNVSAPPPQLAAPISDTSVGTWTTDSGGTTNLYQAIDEASPGSDADYIRSVANPQAAVYEAGLTGLTDPAVSTGHVLRVRALHDGGVGGAVSLTSELRQGGSALSTPASWTDVLTGSAQTFEHTLSGAMADAISNYTTLRLRFTATQAAPPLPTWQATGTGSGGQATATPAWPSHVAGDIGLLFVESSGGEPVNLGTPAGFAVVTNSPQATGTTTNGTRLSVFWCRATSGAMGTPTVDDAGNHVWATIVTYRGCVSTGNPWNVTGGGVKAAAAANVTLSAVTTTVDNCLIVQAVAWDLDNAGPLVSGQSNANLANINERYDLGTALGTGGGFAVWDGEKASAGDIGTSTATIISSINAFLTIALVGENAARARVTWAQLEVPFAPQDIPELAGRPFGQYGQRQMHQLLAQ